MSQLDVCLEDGAATESLGAQLAGALDGGAVLFLIGTLGAGKTTLTRGILRALGHRGAVKSPTYTLVEPYELARRTVFHFDLYRLADPEELEYMGIRDYFSQEHLCVVEWPQKGEGFLPVADITLNLKVEGQGRLAHLHSGTALGERAIENIKTLG